MIVNPSQPAVQSSTQATLGPRAQLFGNIYATVIKGIAQKALQNLIDAQSMSFPAFLTKHITEEGQKKLQSLDDRTKILAKMILCDTLCMLVKPPFQVSFEMLKIGANDETIQGKYLSEVALPFITQLVVGLNKEDPDLISEATSAGIDEDRGKILEKFHISF